MSFTMRASMKDWSCNPHVMVIGNGSMEKYFVEP